MKAHISNKKNPMEQHRSIGKPFASDEEFWKALDDIAQKEPGIETIRDFIHVLKKGYIEQRNILIIGVDNLQYKNKVNQACVWNGKNKVMLYLTDKKYDNPNYTCTPLAISQKPKCMEVYIRDVINNALEKEEVSALIFNQGSDHEIIIPKLLLSVVFGEIHDIPSFLD